MTMQKSINSQGIPDQKANAGAYADPTAPEKCALLLETLKKDVARLTHPRGYLHAGLPKFDEIFGRDSLITMLQLLKSQPEIARSTLIALAELQGTKVDPITGEEPGKILHEFSEIENKGLESLKGSIGWWKSKVPYYFSIDSTPLFITAFAEYYSMTKDEELLCKLWPNLVAAAKWILDYGITDDLLRYGKPANGNGLQSQSWKDGVGNMMDKIVGPVAVVEVQGYAYHALRAFAKLAEYGNENELSSRSLTASEKLKARFDRDFWSEKDKFYYLAIDGNGDKIMKVTSNPGHLLFTGILDKSHAEAVVKRLMQPDMLTEYGIRTHSSLDVDFDEYAYQLGSIWPHDNWIISKGMKRMGFKSEYFIVRDSILRAYEELRSTPEYWSAARNGRLIKPEELKEPPCDPQAWTAGTMIHYLQEILYEAMKARMRS